MKTYQEGTEKIDDEMNIVNIIKIIRELKILLNYFAKNPKIGKRMY